MDTSAPSKDWKKKYLLLALFILVAMVVSGLVGWNIARNKKMQAAGGAGSANIASNQTPKESLVNYTLPDAWKEGKCPPSEAVFVVPNGAKLDCGANPSSPVKISVDPNGATDCNQLQSVQNVKKHICASEFINGKKALRAETIYNQDSTYKKDTTIRAYHINIGTEVVKVEYVYNSDGEFNAGFEQLAKSVSVKN